jgi:hypothetical protein
MRIASVDPEVVAVEARRSLVPSSPTAVVVPIGARLAHRPVPTLAGYEELLEAGR